MSEQPFTPPRFTLPANWQNVAVLFASTEFTDEIFPALLRQARWFGGKAHPLSQVRAVASLTVGDSSAGRIFLLEAGYADRSPETYVLPLQIAPAAPEKATVVAYLEGGVLFDALYDSAFRDALFEMILREQNLRDTTGVCGATLKAAAAGLTLPLSSQPLAAEQSNSAILYGGRFFLKLYRKPEEGENPDAELIRFLSERQHFRHVPAFCGAIEHCIPLAPQPRTLALLVAHVPNEGDAWAFTLAHMNDSDYPARARQLGQRTAGMHLALAADLEDPAFAPESFTDADQHTLCEATRKGARQTLALLEKRLPEIPAGKRADAEALLARADEIFAKISAFEQCKISATKTRHHGDYHLGQVLNTGDDFVIIDFEGEPARTLAERRMKRSPLRDVAGMLRSFHYAAHSVPEPSEAWAQNISRIFLESWLATARGASFIPDDPHALTALLEIHLLEKAIYEISYELNHRPDWVSIPVLGVLQILDNGIAP